MNGQVLFDDLVDSQNYLDFFKTEQSRLNRGIERMITKKLDGMEKVVETKIEYIIIDGPISSLKKIPLKQHVDSIE